MTKRALVTGAASGIGRAIAIRLAASGNNVLLTDINEEGLAQSCRDIEAAGGTCDGRYMDVTSTQSVTEAVHEEQIDILVNAAGWDDLKPFLATDEAFWDRIIELNFKGVLRTTHTLLPGMIERSWGRVINISSDAGRVGSSLEAVYSGAKGGIIAFSKTAAREVARKGVTVNTVCPGPTDTRLLDEIVSKSDNGERVIDSMVRGVPMKRLGTAEDIAGAVNFLASDEADYITGQTLSVSGGLTMA
ncbi:MAG: SDR family NAD(P)-dependent oxidoreductase [Pseudomonadota bacterium]